MPKAIIINPNTSEWMTDVIDQSASRVFDDPWKHETRRPSGGVESIDTLFESSLAVVAILDLLDELEDADGVVLACFSDPGLFEFREILSTPVVGIAEAGFLTACMISHKFGILGGSRKDIPWMENLLWKYGMEKRCSAIEPLSSEGVMSEGAPEDTRNELLHSSQVLIDGGAESLILGCAGWGTHRQAIQREYNIPIIDPVEAACWQLKALVEMGLRTSMAGLFSRPQPKEPRGLGRILSSKLAEGIGGKLRTGFTSEEGIHPEPPSPHG